MFGWEKWSKMSSLIFIWLTMRQETDANMYTHFWEDFCIFKYLNYHIFIVHKGGLHILINVHLYFEYTQYTFDMNWYFQAQWHFFLSSDMLLHFLLFQPLFQSWPYCLNMKNNNIICNIRPARCSNWHFPILEYNIRYIHYPKFSNRCILKC